MTAALVYARRGLAVFPCCPAGPPRKQPMTAHGLRDATTDERRIRRWWAQWPGALVGMATGEPSGRVVLDIDAKGGANGYDTLSELGFPEMPSTQMVRTPSGGLHLHFRPPATPFGNTQGAAGRGIGPGLDWRAWGGYVILPSEGSGYVWVNGDAPLLPVPAALLPREPVRRAIGPVTARYGDVDRVIQCALNNACAAIRCAACGAQESTLTWQATCIGSLVGGGQINRRTAEDALRQAGRAMTNYYQDYRWTDAQIDKKISAAIDRGIGHPRIIRARGEGGA